MWSIVSEIRKFEKLNLKTSFQYMQGRIKLLGGPLPYPMGARAPYNMLMFDQIIMNCTFSHHVQ